MKKNYVAPQTREVVVNTECVMVQMSTLMIEDLEVPPMGNYAPASFKDL